jgi:diadenosine tetraphosphate (Ap4A) HIT family hydrolase
MIRRAGEQPGAYLRRLPIGERLPLGEVANSDLFPLEGEILVKPLEPPILPEPLRRGETGGDPCLACANERSDFVVWGDERWRLGIASEPSGLPMVAVLQPLAHHDLEDLPVELTGQLGLMIQRVARAIGRLDSVGRVHVNRWGDGSQHFHLWFLARPQGMWQMRGAMLAVWDDLLPRVPDEEWREARRRVAAAMAEEGGTVLVE